MPRNPALPLLLTAALLSLGACGGARGPDPVSAPVPAHPAGAEQLGDEPSIGAARPVAVPSTLLGSAHYDLPLEANQWVQGELDFLVNQRHAVIGAWLQRADFYQPWVKDVFGAAGVPRDLSHLAMVESGFLPTARSRAGAVGMWQFMAGTGRGMGLRVDEIVDERMDPVRSTRAAARHLRDLNQAFNGDWALAIAAYNAGTGRISRGLRTYNVSSFWDLAQAGNLAEETRRYVPRLYAVTVIAHEPSRFGYAAPTGPVRRFAFDSVRVDVMTPLSQLAETGGVPLGDLVELNPHLVRGTAPADYWVWTPAGTGAAVQQAFNTSDFRRSGGYGYYLARTGDDFVRLAAAAGLSVDQVRAMNPHVDASGLARGQRLVFPVGVATLLASRPVERVAVAEDADRPARGRASGGANGNRNGSGNAESGDDASRSDDPGARAASPARSARTASGDRPSPDRPSSDRTPGEGAGDRSARARRDEGGDGDRRDAQPATFAHTVKRGETLASLAARFDVPTSRILSVNGLESRRLRPGQVLRIPRPAGEQAASADRPARPADEPRALAPFVHTVGRGETLASMAERFDVTPARIRALNDLEAGARVRPGQKLRIPRNAEPRAASDSDAAPARSARSTQGDAETPARGTRAASPAAGDAAPRTFAHTVKRGETLASLAERFDVPPSRIRAANDLEADARLRPGQVIRVPRADDGAQAGRAESPASTRPRRAADAPAPEADAGAARTFVHTVARGETLPSLAERFDVPPSRIRALNDLESGARITPGQKLRIPRPADEQPAARTAASGRTDGASGAASRPRASAGAEAERSTAPARRSRATGDAAAERDSSASARRSRGSSGATADRASSSTTRRPRASDDGAAERPAGSRRTAGKDAEGGTGSAASRRFTEHTVAAGETLYSLARRYSVTVAQIRAANDLGADEALAIGRKLRIPRAAGR